jgi:hypothetical protein
MKVSQSVLILTGQIIQSGVDMVCEADLKTGRLQDFDAGLKIRFIKRARRRDDADSVPRPEPGGFYDRYAFDKAYPLVNELNDNPACGRRNWASLLIYLEDNHQTLKGQEFFNMLDCLRDITDKGCKTSGGDDRGFLT